MELTELARKVCRYIDKSAEATPLVATALPELTLLKYDHPQTLDCTLYNPAVCLILQGRKETILGDRTVSFGAGQSVIVSHDLPVVSRVTEASTAAPYATMVIALNLGIARSLYDDVSAASFQDGDGMSVDSGDADKALVDAMVRYFELLERPLEAKVLGPLILKEVHFRALMAPHGRMFRNLLRRDSHASRIAQTIDHIRQNFRSAIAVSDLAKVAGMSVSSFHEHFKQITTTTPLQYQKDLRLMEARRLLSEGDHSVSRTAFEVGYESPTQFSREYARRFGASPRADLRARDGNLVSSNL